VGPYDRAPFRWTERHQQTLPVQITGELPEWLRGQLVRTAPAVFERAAWRAGHLFDGLSLLYGFTIEPGRVTFRQRLLASKTVDAIDRGKPVSGFATRLQRSWLQRLLHPIPPVTDNTNVNVVPFREHWLALTESQEQHCIDADSLASRGLLAYDDELPRMLLMSAHPQPDPRGAGLVNVGTAFGGSSAWVVFRQAGAVRQVEGKLPLKRVPYLHSFGVSREHVVLVDHPLRANPVRMLFSNRGYIDHFRWRPERGTRLWKLERRSGKFTAYETEPLFCFHTVSAFDDGEDVVVDLLAYDDPQVVHAFRTETLASGAFPAFMPRYLRARLSPSKRRVELEPLSDARFEFPVTAPQRAAPRRHAWGVHLSEDPSRAWSSQVVHVAPGTSTRFEEPGFAWAEPNFVARPGAQDEDDGVLLTLGHHTQRDLSALAILDARTLEPRARCEVPLSLPFGFHGNFRSTH
jgi:beta,beta-carotene 9',10'-dioxygenase